MLCVNFSSNQRRGSGEIYENVKDSTPTTMTMNREFCPEKLDTNLKAFVICELIILKLNAHSY